MTLTVRQALDNYETERAKLIGHEDDLAALQRVLVEADMLVQVAEWHEPARQIFTEDGAWAMITKANNEIGMGVMSRLDEAERATETALKALILAGTEFDQVADYDRQMVDGYYAFALAEAVGEYLSTIGH